MSENEIRERLRDAVGGHPEVRPDPDEMIRRARQQTARRRALGGAMAATVVAVGSAVVIGSSLGGTDATPGARPGPAVAPTTAPVSATTTPVSATAPPSTWNPPGAVPPTLTEAQAKALATRLGAAAKAKVAALPGTSRESLIAFAGEAEGDISAGQRHLNGAVPFTLGGARYVVAVSVLAPGQDVPGPSQSCAYAPPGTCEVRPIDGGEVITVVNDVAGEFKMVSVRHFRADGTVVEATGFNGDTFSPGAPAYQPAVPVSVEQLTALAKDPEFSFRP